jgi:5-methylcytosine-specific restriction protein B
VGVSTLEVPINVYFTGTVNVDETTFTFSPKVLDRANVIEFGDVDLDGYWQEQENAVGESRSADEAIVTAFTYDFTYPFATGLRGQAGSDPTLASYRDQLSTLVHLLEPYHMHFGYRVADEILAYLFNAQNLADREFDLDLAFDHAILQKVLPRFHGSRARLWQPLLRLLAFCAWESSVAEDRAKDWDGKSFKWIQEEVGQEKRLVRSTGKLLRMLRDLDQEGFFSFS